MQGYVNFIGDIDIKNGHLSPDSGTTDKTVLDACSFNALHALSAGYPAVKSLRRTI